MQDEFRVLRDSIRGSDYVINDNLIIHDPTLDEICDFGEFKYYSVANALTCSAASYKVAIWDMFQIYWTELSDFDFFILMCASLPRESTSIILGNLNLAGLIRAKAPNGQIVLARESEEGLTTIIDQALYSLLASHIRQMHGFDHTVEIVKDEHTKKYMVERERRRLLRHKNDKHKSILRPLVSSMVNHPGFKYDYSSVWNLPISIFNESVERVQKRMHYTQFMQGVYNGVIDMKKANIKTEELNWLS